MASRSPVNNQEKRRTFGGALFFFLIFILPIAVLATAWILWSDRIADAPAVDGPEIVAEDQRVGPDDMD